jgi:DNA-binding CsgD family transcriptional regulator
VKSLPCGLPNIEREPLTKSELPVARFILDGHSNLEIANLLFVDIKAVKFHITNIYQKLSIKTRSQFIVKYLPHRQRAKDAAEIERLHAQVVTLERLIGQKVIEHVLRDYSVPRTLP